MATKTEESVKKREEKAVVTQDNISESSKRSGANKGTWTAEEDEKLSQVISIHSAKRWKTLAAKAGLNRNGKSCRLRWLNYLRPNIKRGNISDQEEDLILRLHKLLGNRWSLIAGRLPGRTDNEIKNYWNSHLSKKVDLNQGNCGTSTRKGSKDSKIEKQVNTFARDENSSRKAHEDSKLLLDFDVDDFFDFSNEEPSLEWVSRFVDIS